MSENTSVHEVTLGNIIYTKWKHSMFYFEDWVLETKVKNEYFCRYPDIKKKSLPSI